MISNGSHLFIMCDYCYYDFTAVNIFGQAPPLHSSFHRLWCMSICAITDIATISAIVYYEYHKWQEFQGGSFYAFYKNCEIFPANFTIC